MDNWAILAAPHDQEGSNELFRLLSKYYVREFMMGDRFRAFYSAQGLNFLTSSAWHNGRYIGDAKAVAEYIGYNEDQGELPLG